MKQNIIAGNWKMNKTIPGAIQLVRDLRAELERNPPRKTKVVIAPPFTVMAAIAKEIQGSQIELGAQNIAWAEEGAYTGEISAKMIKDIGAQYVIIGHSERRTHFKEDAAEINKKIKVALNNDLKVIYCVGEALEDREQELTMDIVSNQIEWDLKGCGDADIQNIIVAYEPVWAIGTGKTATPEQAQEVHQFIRDILVTFFKDDAENKLTILYGGSMKPGNANGLLRQPDIDGGLVGGACLNANNFMKIIQASEDVT